MATSMAPMPSNHRFRGRGGAIRTLDLLNPIPSQRRTTPAEQSADTPPSRTKPALLGPHSMALPMAAFVVAQALDLGTWLAFSPHEMNPIVRALGDAAPLLKVAMVTVLVLLFRRPKLRHRQSLVMGVGTLAGLVGAFSNLEVG